MSTASMPTQTIAWPKKTRELQNFALDSTRWNGFPFRDDDIVVATWSKSGTTLVQQIVSQLVFKGADDIFGQTLSPWIDLRIAPRMLEMAAAQTHRRFLKTHLPLDALVFSPKAKYLYVGRDARDVAWSWYHHQSTFSAAAYEALNNPPGRPGALLERPDPDIRRYYHAWLDRDASPNAPFWQHVQSWWNIRHLPNVLMIHYANLKADKDGEMRRIARFLGISIDEAGWPTVIAHCEIDFMRKQAAKSEMLDWLFEGGGTEFIHKGTNGRWRDVLSAEEIAKADEAAAKHLTPDCAHWLATGELPE
jgi:aryl sulfotransferase